MSFPHSQAMVNARRVVAATRSGHPAAWAAFGYRLAAPVSRCVDWLAQRPVTPSAGGPIVFITGPPRSGSTVVYQALSRAIDCVYLSNLHFLAPHGASRYMLARGLFGSVRGPMRSYYGHTVSPFDVNEGNRLLLPLIAALPHEAGRERMGRFAAAMGAQPGRPLVFKNAAAFLQASTLHASMPELVVLRVRRNPERIAESSIRAYRELRTFNPIPPGLHDRSFDDPVAFAVKQVAGIERELDAQRPGSGDLRWLEWSYEEFCERPWEHIRELAYGSLRLSARSLRSDALPPMTASTRSRLSSHERTRLLHLLAAETFSLATRT